MNRLNKALLVLFVAAMGLWGCAQGPTGGSAGAERLKALEAKVAKLEEDQKTLTTARDQVRKKLTESEDQRVKLEQKLAEQQMVVKERDALQGQLDQLRSGIRGLLSQAEATARPNGQPLTAAPMRGAESF